MRDLTAAGEPSPSTDPPQGPACGRGFRSAPWFGAGLVALLLAVGVTVWLLTPGGPTTGGPLDDADAEYRFTDRFSAGDSMTGGAVLLRFDGDKPVTIVKVESFGDGTFKQVGALVAGPEREMVQDVLFRQFPPKARWLGELHDAEGLELSPTPETGGFGHELLIGYRVTQDSEPGIRTEVVVTYECSYDILSSYYRPIREYIAGFGVMTARTS